MVQETRIIHYTWEETELETDRAKRLSIHPLNKPSVCFVRHQGVSGTQVHYAAGERYPVHMWKRKNKIEGGKKEEEPDRQIWNSSCMLSDMWQGFGERNQLGRGVSEKERRRGVYREKWGHIKNDRWTGENRGNTVRTMWKKDAVYSSGQLHQLNPKILCHLTSKGASTGPLRVILYVR